MRKRQRKNEEADLDITSFMNLMIILVPVLLMTMVLSHISVLDLKLPDLSSNSAAPEDEKKNEILEVVIEPTEMVVNYPAGAPLRRIPQVADEETGEMGYDYEMLQTVLREVKRLLKDQGVEKKDILILSQPDTDYQTIIRSMDTVRSFKAVSVASVVDAELFPAISLGDAPPPAPGQTGGAQ